MENLGSSSASLLTTPCAYDASNNLTLTVKSNEIAYVGFVSGCVAGASDVCVVTNSVDTQNNVCHVNSLKGITILGAGGAGTPTEKVVIDYSNSLFNLGKIAVTLDTSAGHLSNLVVIPPTTGSNMALGQNGVQADTTAARTGGAKLDIALKWSTAAAPGTVVFQGGAGADTFIADLSGLSAPPAGWDTVAHVSAIVGAAYPGALTVSGGAGNDTIAGGAGSNTLLGGQGDDTFLQSTKFNAETMQGNDGFDTVDYSARTTGVTVAVGVNGGVSAATLGVGGAGYKANDILNVSGGAAPATVKVTTVSGTGAVTAFTVATPGAGYSVANALATTGGTGSGATVNVTTLMADDGAPGEKDDVNADVERVKGGAGNDILDASNITLTDVVLMGQGGADTLKGGAGADDLCGGAGNDRLYWSGCSAGSCPATSTGDFLAGGGGVDTADYSTASGAVMVCLDPTDTTCLGSTPQNGVVGAVDIINDPTFTACPGARAFTIACGAGVNSYTPGASYTCGTATYTAVAAGAALSNDVQNVTGHPTLGSILDCGSLACTIVGGSGADTLTGSAQTDAIFGAGGGDTILTAGGTDLVDVTHTGPGVTDDIDCNGNGVTILADVSDTVKCATAAASGTYHAACGAAPAASNACSAASIIQQ